ncbi:hypothetical protein [Streptomyces sp. NPDC055709]
MTPRTPWHWSQSRFGGGGYITGLQLDPFDPDRLYARSDVAGAFVSDNAGASWSPRNAGLSQAHEHMVAALVPSPHTPGLLLRCSGDARGGRTYGAIHRSTDHGRTWRQATTDIDFYGNGPTRMFGEVCAFDPHTPGRVLAGGYRAGLWGSDDDGLTWQRRGLHGERIGVVAFHPAQAGVVYAGTIGDAGISGLWAMGDRPLAEVVLEHGDIPRGTDASLYRSDDGGTTWRPVFRHEDWAVGGLAFDPDIPEHLLAAGRNGVWRSTDGGRSFTRCTDGLDSFCDYVAADPHRPGRFLTSPHRGGVDIPLYETLDHGRTWHRLRSAYTMADLADYPSYITSPAAIGTAISTVVFHPAKRGRFYLTGYFGVSVSDDDGRTFSGQGFRGTETTCAESVVTDPANGAVYVGLADHSPAVSHDGGRTYHRVPGPGPSAALAPSPHKAEVLLWGVGGRRANEHDAHLVRYDSSAQSVHTFHGRRFIQAVTCAPHEHGRVYALVDGDVDDTADSAGVHRSDDGGRSWDRLPSPFPANIHRLPVEEEWIESELLPVVVYQKRNAAGANQLLAADPHVPGRVWVGERALGLYRSDDAGQTWRRADAGLPFGVNRTAVLSHLLPDPRRPDWIYAGFVAEGLWRSIDAGGAWTRVATPGATNATSVAVSGDRVAVACEPMWWTGTPARMLLSEDLGATWCDIHPAEFGAVRWKGVAFDAAGTLHAVSCGNGMFTARPISRGEDDDTP